MEFRRRKDDHRVFALGGNNATMDTFVNMKAQDEMRARLASMKHDQVSLGSGAVRVPEIKKVATGATKGTVLDSFFERIKAASPDELRALLRQVDHMETSRKLTNKEGVARLRSLVKERLEFAEARQKRDPFYKSPTDQLVDRLTGVVMDGIHERQKKLGNDTGVLVPDAFLERMNTRMGYEQAKDLLKKLDTVTETSMGEWREFSQEILSKPGKPFKDEGMDPEVKEAVRTLLKRKVERMEQARVEAKKRDEEYKVKEQQKRDRVARLEAGKIKSSDPEYYRAINDADTAVASKFLKKELAEKFPGVKFRVRTDRYSGGSSVHVNYTDGPSSDAVDAVVKKYSEDLGSDSMTDYFHVNRYASAQRTYSNEALEDAKRKYQKKFGKPYNEHDVNQYREYYQILRESNLPAKDPPSY